MKHSFCHPPQTLFHALPLSECLNHYPNPRQGSRTFISMRGYLLAWWCVIKTFLPLSLCLPCSCSLSQHVYHILPMKTIASQPDTRNHARTHARTHTHTQTHTHTRKHALSFFPSFIRFLHNCPRDSKSLPTQRTPFDFVMSLPLLCYGAV